jgi:hypothetical protein
MSRPWPGQLDFSGLEGVMARKFDDETLAFARSLPLSEVLDKLGQQLGFFWRRDPDFQPEKDQRTVRLYVSREGAAWELLVTGAKWFDTRANKGGEGDRPGDAPGRARFRPGRQAACLGSCAWPASAGAPRLKFGRLPALRFGPGFRAAHRASRASLALSGFNPSLPSVG